LVVRSTINNPDLSEYVEAFQPWAQSVDVSVFAKDMAALTV